MTLGDVIVLAVLGLIVGAIVAGMVRDKKKGRCCGCGGCTSCDHCGGKEQE